MFAISCVEPPWTGLAKIRSKISARESVDPARMTINSLRLDEVMGKFIRQSQPVR